MFQNSDPTKRRGGFNGNGLFRAQKSYIIYLPGKDATQPKTSDSINPYLPMILKVSLSPNAPFLFGLSIYYTSLSSFNAFCTPS